MTGKKDSNVPIRFVDCSTLKVVVVDFFVDESDMTEEQVADEESSQSFVSMCSHMR